MDLCIQGMPCYLESTRDISPKDGADSARPRRQ